MWNMRSRSRSRMKHPRLGPMETRGWAFPHWDRAICKDNTWVGVEVKIVILLGQLHLRCLLFGETKSVDRNRNMHLRSTQGGRHNLRVASPRMLITVSTLGKIFRRTVQTQRRRGQSYLGCYTNQWIHSWEGKWEEVQKQKLIF